MEKFKDEMAVMPTWRWLVISTWVFIILGFINPVFFLIGIVAFLIAMCIWTYKAIDQRVDAITITLIWFVPVVMITFLGFGGTILPTLPEERDNK